jgi:hypothetical protein
MKVICDCGAKYAFDATPEMLRNPIQFACPTCGVDLSARINDLVREQFSASAAPAVSLAPAPEIAPPPGAAFVAPAPAVEAAPVLVPMPSAPPQVRLSHGPARAATEEVTDDRFCAKHLQQRVTEKCRVCGKAICPLCMQLFGYVCSAHCKEKASLQGIKLPKYAAQRDEVQRQQWRKMGLVVKIAAALVITVVGVWIWYAWFGSRPRPVFAVRFEEESAMSGTSAFCEGEQMVFIHGAKLARYDLKKKEQVWRVDLVDKKVITAEAEADYKEMQEAAAQSESPFKLPSLGEMTKDRIRWAEARLELRVHGQNVWVADGEKVRRFDWNTGAAKNEVEFAGSFAAGILRGDELEFKESVSATRLNVTRFNLASGQLQKDSIGEAPPVIANAGTTTNRTRTPVATRPATNVRTATPQQLAAAVANAPLAGRLAAPATISVARNQQQALDMMEEMDGEYSAARFTGNPADEDAYLMRPRSRLIPTGGGGFVQMNSQMTEKNIITRSAAKAAPKKSALDGPVNASATMDIANELLNEMSRNAGADLVTEDLSKYKVKIRRGGGPEVSDWEGEVVGAPALYPQATVNVLVAGKTLIVLDHQNKKKWESTLNYPLSGGGSFLDEDSAEQRGLGPVVERGDTLYVYDQGVLSAFEIATGTARWRLPSVGITGMFFDDDGMIYLNTTTASPDKIKYSRQIDVNDSTADIVLKLDAKSGKEIWKHSMGGSIAYLKGKYIYTLTYTPPRDDDDEWDENLAVLGLESKPFIRIRRISPKNGRVLWDHYQPRGALDVQIRDNTFQLVLKKEVQVLRFLSL